MLLRDSELSQRDVSLDGDVGGHALYPQHGPGLEGFIALELAGLERSVYRAFDLALRGDAELLEELADTDVEGLFVHGTRLHVRAAAAPAARRKNRAAPVLRPG